MRVADGFHLLPGLGQKWIFFRAPFDGAGLSAVEPLRYCIQCDGVEHLGQEVILLSSLLINGVKGTSPMP